MTKECPIIIKQYLSLYKRWWWLLVLGLVLGGAGGYFFSQYQEPVYQASSRLMFFLQNQSDSGSGSNLAYLNERNTAQTLAALVVARPVIDATEDKLGYRVSQRQVFAQQVGDTPVIELTVVDGDPEDAAEIANTVVTVFMDQQKDLSASLFASSEESLKRQVDQVKAQMDALQADSIEEAQQLKKQQVADLEKTIASLRTEIATLQQDLIELQFAGTPVPGFDENRRWTLVLPTPSIEQRIEISAKNERLDEASRLFSLYERVYVQLTQEENANQVSDAIPDDVRITLDQYQVIYRNLLQNYEAIRLARIQSTPDLLLVESATVPENPVQPIPVLYTLFGSLLGLIVSAGLAFAFVNTDEVFRTPEETRALLRLPILAYVRNLKEPLALPDPKDYKKEGTPYYPTYGHYSLSGDGLRFLRSNLEMLQEERPFRKLLVTAPGDTLTGPLLAVRLAQIIAHAGRRVLLLDGDLRQPQVDKLLEKPNVPGLSEVLEGQALLEKVIVSANEDCLSMVSGGSPQAAPSDIMNRKQVGSILRDLETHAELIIVNSPPFAFAEAGMLASQVDAVVLAIEMGQTRSSTALATLDQLQLSRANVIGLVIIEPNGH